MKTHKTWRGISFLAVLAVLAWPSGQALAYHTGLPEDYKPSAIPTFTGDSRAYDINLEGDVCGYWTKADGNREAVVWHDTNHNGLIDPGEVNGLGTLGGTESGAFAINKTGQVAGWSWTTGNVTHQATLWTDGNANWQADPGELAGLGYASGGNKSRAYAINNSGQTAGFSFIASGERDPMRWTDANGNHSGDPGEMIALGTLGGHDSYGEGINNLGHVVGYSQISTGGPNHAFKWVDADNNGQVDPGEMMDLGTLGGTNSRAWAINDAGITAGESDLADGHTHAFIHNDLAGMVDIGTLGGTDSWAYDVNALGHVVGMSLTASGEKHAFLWDGIGMTDLNDMLPANSGWVLTTASAVNDIDMVVGWGFYNGERRGYVMTHAPEPATLLLVGSGLFGLIMRRKRNG